MRPICKFYTRVQPGTGLGIPALITYTIFKSWSIHAHVQDHGAGAMAEPGFDLVVWSQEMAFKSMQNSTQSLSVSVPVVMTSCYGVIELSRILWVAPTWFCLWTSVNSTRLRLDAIQFTGAFVKLSGKNYFSRHQFISPLLSLQPTFPAFSNYHSHQRQRRKGDHLRRTQGRTRCAAEVRDTLLFLISMMLFTPSSCI